MARGNGKSWRQRLFGSDEQPKHCDAPGCVAEGIYRAPRAKADLNNYYMFCLDHVRQYNLTWDYFAGMSIDEIESQIRRDTVWERPTWPLGGRSPWQVGEGHDSFRFAGAEEAVETEPRRRRFSASEEHALALLEVEPPVTLARVKLRYKALVKRHHPDANGGDRAAEERLKEINQAYSTLKAAALP